MQKKNSIEDRLLEAEVAIKNSLDDTEILADLTNFGYNEAKLNVGKKLQEEADKLNKKQIAEYGDQYAATNEVGQAWDNADKAYMRALKVARVALKDNVKAQGTLLLSGRRKNTLSGWLDQAAVFYENLLDNTDLMAEMQNYGFSEHKLNEGKALVNEVAKAHRLKEKETGEAQDATKERDAKMDELDEWMSDFKAIARVALEDHAQRLEKLGIFVKS